jgi:hypothetical protein
VVAVGETGAVGSGIETRSGPGLPGIGWSGTAFKLTPAGALDPAFGDRGATEIDLLHGITQITAAAAPNGRIMIGGLGGPTSVWAGRLNPDGTPDRTFAPDGKASLVLGNGATGTLSEPTGPVVQSDGKVFLGGAVPAGGFTHELAVARLVGGVGRAIAAPSSGNSAASATAWSGWPGPTAT